MEQSESADGLRLTPRLQDPPNLEQVLFEGSVFVPALVRASFRKEVEVLRHALIKQVQLMMAQERTRFAAQDVVERL